MVLPGLHNRLADGSLSLDRLTGDFFRLQLGYRWIPMADGREAHQVEREIQKGALGIGMPLLNPLSDRLQAQRRKAAGRQ